MRKVYIKERSFYTIESLARVLGVEKERAAEYIEVLTTRGVLRLRSGNDEDEFDTEDASKYKGTYQFVYVGLAIVDGLVLIVYPKYMDERRFENNTVGTSTQAALRQVFAALRKSSGSYSDIVTLNESSRHFNDRIACMLMLIEMYSEYGEYSNYVRTLQEDGFGDISWERTIAMHQPFLQDGVPIYFDYETITNTKDNADFITRLHRCILTECSNKIAEYGIADILGLEEIELTDDVLDDLGDTEHLLYRLDRERGVQYVTWKQDVIDLMKRYINKEETLIDSDEVVCLGTTSFHHVWEKACKVAFGDLLAKRIDGLGLRLSDEWVSRRNETLLGIIPAPAWSKRPDDGVKYNPQGSLIPDIIAFHQTQSGERVFGILDAKYYKPWFGINDSIYGAPGVGDVTKQILYQQAYKRFILDHGFDRVVNAFLIPSDSAEFSLMGHVEFLGVFDSEEKPFVDGVDMWTLPAQDIWRCYLNGKALSLDSVERMFV